MTVGTDLIAEKRQRQIEVHGWSPEHDAEHTQGELSKAALNYVVLVTQVLDGHPDPTINLPGPGDAGMYQWPWDVAHWTGDPEDPIEALANAGALIAAEIDRLVTLQAQFEAEGWAATAEPEDET